MGFGGLEKFLCLLDRVVLNPQMGNCDQWKKLRIYKTMFFCFLSQNTQIVLV